MNQPKQIHTYGLNPKPRPEMVSLVMPVFNEIEVLPLLREVIAEWRESFDLPLELVFVDDGSSDDSLGYLKEWAAEDDCLQVISFSRNFGHQSAIYAGLVHASGDVAVVMDADLQDPLSMIPEMIERYVEGFEIVYGQREERTGESAFKRLSAWAFYRLMHSFVHSDLPVDTGDFRLVSRPVIEVLRTMPEKDRFLRGMFAWMGFPSTSVRYRREERAAGETKFSLFKMCRFAFCAAISFSAAPIRLISLAGVLTAAFGFTYGTYTVARWLLVGDTVQGWPSIIVLICLIGGMILVGLGVVGEYVGRIYEASKSRPSFIVKEQIQSTPHQGE